MRKSSVPKVKEKKEKKEKKIKKERRLKTPDPAAPNSKKRFYFLDALCVVSGGFFLAIYLPYFFWHASKGHIADVIASLLVFAGVLIPFALRKVLKKWLRKAYLPLKIVWCAAMCFYMVSFSVFFTAVHTHNDVPHVQTDKQKIVVVFGCQVHANGALSSELSSRMKKAAQVLEDYPDALCVVSGGQGSDEPVSEASAMKDYLIQRAGIGEDRILTEEASTSTAENVRFSLQRLKEEGYAIEDCSFICVSSTFHTPRIYYLCTKMGVTECATVSSPTPHPFLDFTYTVREYMSYVYLLLFGY